MLTPKYPGVVVSSSDLPDVVDTVTEMTSTDINPVYAEIYAIETELGTDPAGTVATVKLRLAQSLDGAGCLDFATATELTISAGAITPTQNWHVVDTESDAASDDLATIGTTDTSDGFVLFLRQVNDARDITIKHSTGNILCPGDADILLTDSSQAVLMLYDALLEKWTVISSPHASLLNGTNTFTGVNTFSAATNYAYTTKTSAATLDGTHQIVDVNATAGAVVITLPTAVGINGRQYTVRKSDAGGNAVTITAAGAELINGLGTKALSAQYDTATIVSTGAAWIVI